MPAGQSPAQTGVLPAQTGIFGARTQVLLLSGDQFHGLMHIREPGIIGLLFFGEQRRDTGKQGRFVILDFFQFDHRFLCSGKKIGGILLAVCQRVMGCTGAECQHFSAQTGRVISGSQADQVGFARISKLRADFHRGE